MSSTSFVMPNDLSALCRVCLQLPEESQYLDLTTIYDEEDNLTYGECFTICTRINLSEGEGVPHYLCKSCGLELQMSYDFYKKVEDSRRIIEQCQKQAKVQSLNASEEHNETSCDIEQRLDKYVISDYCMDSSNSNNNDESISRLQEFIGISNGQERNEIEIVDKTIPNEIKVEEDNVINGSIGTGGSSQESNTGADIEEHLDIEDYQNLEALEEEDKSKESMKKLQIKKEFGDIEDNPLIKKLTNKTSVQTTLANELSNEIKIENDNANGSTKTLDEIKIENEIISEYIVSSPTIIAGINPPIPKYIEGNKNSSNKTARSKRISTAIPPFECEYCGYSLPTRNALYQHRRRKHKRKESHHRNTTMALICRLCSKNFSMMASLRLHMNTEHRGIGFLCEHCNHNLPTKNALYKHRLRKHPNMEMKEKKITLKLKPIQSVTTSDNKGSLVNQNSSRKRIIKESDIWFECNDCGHKLPTKNALCQHRLRKHRNRQKTKSFPCKYCETVLNSNKRLQTHLKYSHEILPALKEMVDRL